MTKAVFEKQPPSNLRKSNFFHFVLSLYDKNNNAVETDKGLFVGFVKDDETEEVPGRNGIHYRLSLTYPNGMYVFIKLTFLYLQSWQRKEFCLSFSKMSKEFFKSQNLQFFSQLPFKCLYFTTFRDVFEFYQTLEYYMQKRVAVSSRFPYLVNEEKRHGCLTRRH